MTTTEMIQQILDRAHEKGYYVKSQEVVSTNSAWAYVTHPDGLVDRCNVRKRNDNTWSFLVNKAELLCNKPPKKIAQGLGIDFVRTHIRSEKIAAAEVRKLVETGVYSIPNEMGIPIACKPFSRMGRFQPKFDSGIDDLRDQMGDRGLITLDVGTGMVVIPNYNAGYRQYSCAVVEATKWSFL